MFARPPQRVVSLVPSDTHSLFALGAGDRVVGRTDYCEEPAEQVARVASCGGTKNIDVDAVLRLGPDLVLANQEENARGPIEALAQAGVQVLVSFPRRVSDGIAHLARLARILGVEREEQARDLVRRGYAAVREAEAARAGAAPVAAFVPIWMDPLMTLNADTFGSDALALAGGRNVFGDRERRYPLAADIAGVTPIDAGERDTRYPRVTLDEVVARAPRLALLPDEPHAFTPADAAVFEGRVPVVRMCSGKDLFWYGAWSVDAIARLRAVVDAAR